MGKKECGCPASTRFLVLGSLGLKAKNNVNMSTRVKRDGVMLHMFNVSQNPARLRRHTTIVMTDELSERG